MRLAGMWQCNGTDGHQGYANADICRYAHFPSLRLHLTGASEPVHRSRLSLSRSRWHLGRGRAFWSCGAQTYPLKRTGAKAAMHQDPEGKDTAVAFRSPCSLSKHVQLQSAGTHEMRPQVTLDSCKARPVVPLLPMHILKHCRPATCLAEEVEVHLLEARRSFY